MTRFHVGEYIRDELESRGWTTRDCAMLMGGDIAVNLLSLDLLIAADESPEGSEIKQMRLGQETANGLSLAFGTSPEVWMVLDEAYHTKDAQ